MEMRSAGYGIYALLLLSIIVEAAFDEMFVRCQGIIRIYP